RFVARASKLLSRRRPNKERRSERRIPNILLASMQILTPFSAGRIEIQILDSSARNVRVKMGSPVEPSAMVMIHSEDTLTFAKVRYCVSAEGFYRVGLTTIDTTMINTTMIDTTTIATTWS